MMDDLTPQATDELDIRASLESAFDTAEDTETTEVLPEQTIDSGEDKPQKTRDATGKFAKNEPTEVEQNLEEVPQVKASPKSLKKELADKHWATLDPELQDALLQRDSDYEKGIEGYRTAAERGNAFEKVISPYMATINQFGVPPEQAAAELFKSDHTLRYGSPQQKMAMMAQIFRDYGINPQETFNYLQNGAPRIDPSIAPYVQELQALKQKQEVYERQQQDRESQALNSEIERAKVGKPHFDAVREDMAALLQAGRATDLDDAYDKAIWSRPDLRATLLQQERDKAAESVKSKVQAQRSQAAAVSVNGSSPVSSSAQPDDLRGVIAAQF
jgi:hypothetical protein